MILNLLFSENEFLVVRGFEYEYWEEGHYTSNSVYRCFAIAGQQQQQQGDKIRWTTSQAIHKKWPN